MAEVTKNSKASTVEGIFEEALALYEKKNKDYGDSFHHTFEFYGPTVCAIRLEDKLNRLKSLVVRKAERQVEDESVEDTLIDIVNYAAMSLRELRLKADK